MAGSRPLRKAGLSIVFFGKAASLKTKSLLRRHACRDPSQWAFWSGCLTSTDQIQLPTQMMDTHASMAAARRIPARRPTPGAVARAEATKKRIRENVARNLFRMRTAADLTQRELSELADVCTHTFGRLRRKLSETFSSAFSCRSGCGAGYHGGSPHFRRLNFAAVQSAFPLDLTYCSYIDACWS